METVGQQAAGTKDRDIEHKDNEGDANTSVGNNNKADEPENDQKSESDQTASELMKQLMKPTETVEHVDKLASQSTEKLAGLNVDIEERREQITATVYGQCIGDAVGLLTEFLSESQAKHYYGKYEHLEYSQKIRDRHRHRWAVGDWTDDSDQMILIMQSLTNNEGEVNHQDFAERLLNWMHYGFPELGDDGGCGIGLTTFETLNHPDFLKDPHKVSEEIWERLGRDAAPNGAVMRTSILGIHDWWDPEKVVENAETVCRTTHHDPRCVVSTICVCVAISFMLERSPEHFKDGVYDVDKIIGDVTKCAKLHIPQDGWEELESYILCTDLADLKLAESHAIGYTYKCLGAGFWALKQDNFREAIEAIVRSGGDADTNAAVAGALLGCKLGSRDHVPETWLSQLKHRHWLDKQIELYLEVLNSRYPAEQTETSEDF